jgi:glycosyltransferase involved in cell wall biosynthesis
MKIAVVMASHPFVRGGAEMHAEAVVAKLNEFGHRAALVNLPLAWHDNEAIVRGMLAASTLRIPHADRVIVHKFPAYYVRHENKVAWIFHQCRQVYDLWSDPVHGWGHQPRALALRQWIRTMDTRELGAIRRYTTSETNRDRLRRFNGLDATLLYHPLPDERGYYCGDYGDYIFCPSRINPMKRQELLVRALGETRTPVRLHLAGESDVGPGEGKRLHDLARSLGVEKRLTLDDHFISEQQKRDLFANSLATAYIPVDEDTYGYVSLESFKSNKAVIAATDSGGVLRIVHDGVSGLVAEPTPAAIADTMDRLYEDRALAQRLGEGGPRLLETMNISWEHAIAELTA